MMEREWGKPFQVQVMCPDCDGKGAYQDEEMPEPDIPVGCGRCKRAGTITVSIESTPAAGCLVAANEHTWGHKPGEWWVLEQKSCCAEPVDIDPLLPSPAQCKGVTLHKVLEWAFANNDWIDRNIMSSTEIPGGLTKLSYCQPPFVEQDEYEAHMLDMQKYGALLEWRRGWK